MRIRVNLIALLLISSSITAPVAFADGHGRLPRRPLSNGESIGEDNLLQLAARVPVVLYQKTLSPLYGSRCRMKPSCSAYSLQAIERHGAGLGILLTFDRLLHEGNEYQVSRVIVEGSEKLLVNGAYVDDPVDNNTFWWQRKRRME